MAQENVVRNVEARRFEVNTEDRTATLTYRMEDGKIVLEDTLVPRELEGRGIGSALAKAGLDYARENSLQVVVECPFVRGYIDRHPEYKDILA